MYDKTMIVNIVLSVLLYAAFAVKLQCITYLHITFFTKLLS